MDRILREPQVRELIGVSARSTLWRMVKAGKFPRPLRLTPRCIGWRESVVDEWIAKLPEVGAEAATTAHVVVAPEQRS